ncbi:DUF998 domain-containing protein [Verrucosispora sp. WMMD573]|uniref:DUF998 domain-containing protein n=1 Tax=Verrucosispora sp. WMMD573 TaxID=3015149 RepID=UPI00248A9E0A|nr:DUF998 domain-containing protein [Verrucosispora sp. WMMD573]WBB56982.1 DUF998 domain-containing protein [Verrucosispora sp. WMMD573]
MAERTAARLAAGAAAGCVGVGVAAVTLAVVAGPGPGLTGYVSEAGVVGSGYAWTYRIGVFALATALLLLAAALRSGDRGPRVAAGLLVASGLATLLSGAVTCSAGCPLPPFERATVADLVHGGASIAATAAVVFAMITIVLAPTARRPLRRIAVLAATVALPLAGAVGLAMLFAGRGSLVGVLERLLLAVAALWGLATALTLTAPRPAVTPTAPAKRTTRPPWPTGPSVPSGRRRDDPQR